MCGNIKSLSVWEGHELVILALEIKECLNFADSHTGGFLAPNLTLLKVHDCLRLKSLPENMDTLLPSLQILDIANYQQVESFPEGKRSAFLRRTSTSLSTLPIKEFQNLRSLDNKGLQLLTSLQQLSISDYPILK
uniref:Uncharacterized protein n=1 Tax=Quercus lobata TaxID=97700 RepID=A0A7N2QWY3_QUELO